MQRCRFKQISSLDQRLTKKRNASEKRRKVAIAASSGTNLSVKRGTLRQPRTCKNGLHPRPAPTLMSIE
jgi:hypothetical protein